MSKLKLNVGEFKDMVSRAVKGASNNGNFQITQLMAIELSDGTLTLTTTDYNNYLYVKKEKVAGDNFYAVVPVDKFSKLIQKTTVENITLEIEDGNKDPDKLIVHGNGRYVLELPYDADGELVEFPDPVSDNKPFNKVDVKLSTIRLLLTTAKAALYTDDMSVPYSGYYVGERVITSDGLKICGVDIKIFDDPVLIPSAFLNLLDVATKEDMEVFYDSEQAVFDAGDVVVYGKFMDNIDEFEVDSIVPLLEEPFPSSCKIDKSSIVQLLDRMSLFVSVLDQNCVCLTFTKDGLNVSSKQKSGDELIPYIESNNFKDFTCSTDIRMLATQIKANHSQTVEIMYGKENTLKLVDGNVRQVIALATEDEDEEDGEE